MSKNSQDLKKRKKVQVRLIKRKHTGAIVGVYRIMDQLITDHHSHLADAKIALAWHRGWNEDADGRVKLGTCKKGSDLDRELHGFDFVITLNENIFGASSFTEEHKAAVIDHQLSHAAVDLDADGKPKADERNRNCYRLKRHEIEEFSDVVARHGIYAGNLEKMAAAIEEARKRPLLAAIDKPVEEPEPMGPDDWQALPLSAAGINGKLARQLAEANIATLGEFAKHTTELGTWWWKEIAGIGEVAAEDLENRMVNFWKEHPEYCEVEKQKELEATP